MVAGGMILLPAEPSPAADPQPYAVTLGKTGDSALDGALTQSSSLVSLQKSAPVGPFALVSRAQDDVGRFQTALHSFGYYKAQVRITIAGRALDDLTLPDLLDAQPAGQSVAVAVSFDTGPLFHLRHVVLDGNVPPDVRAAFGLAPGQPAQAAPVVAARDRVLTALQDDGYALAKVDPPLAILAPADNAVDVTYTAHPGPRVDLGTITLEGLKDVNASYVRRRLLLHPGEQYDPRLIEKARQDLAGTGVFASVQVKPADAPDASGRLPLVLVFTERPRHVVSFDAAYATDLGGSAGVTWTHRNLFGNAEQLTLSAAITELGGSDAKQPGYDVSATFLKPDWLARDQNLQFSVRGVKEYLDSYDRTAVIVGGSVTRKLSEELQVSGGLTVTQERVEQESVTRDYTLVALPIGVKYDSTASLFDPTHGIRANVTITPTQSLASGRETAVTSGGSTTFVIAQIGGSTYFDFGSNGRSVLALRGLVGTAGVSNPFDLPPDQRFYAGGSATIRGYKYQYASPQFPDNKPQGGTSIDAGTIEFRQRFLSSFGFVVFADAGQVGSNATPFEGPLRVGAGVGARYYTAIGPIRLDVAVPLNRVRGNDALEAYIGIGQAF